MTSSLTETVSPEHVAPAIAPAPDRAAGGGFLLDGDMAKKEYERTLRVLQIELLKAQRWIRESGARLVIVFEGLDAAGKGGAIKRFTEHLNPRWARVVALPEPDQKERGQWYFQRYMAHLPTAGEIVFFDRSWYNRAGVEPVMGFCSPAQYREFMCEVPELERGLVKDGIRLFKLWFSISRTEQLRRFQSRRDDPLKRWKLSPVDMSAVDKWDAYAAARDRMFYLTHTPDAPWTVIRSDDKRRARINTIRHVLRGLPYPNREDTVVDEPDALIVSEPDALQAPPDEVTLFE